MNDSDLIKKLCVFRKEAEEGWDSWRTRGLESLGFYAGGKGQWSQTDLAKLEAEGKPALTYNHIKPIVNMISGYQRQNRKDIKAFPRRGSTRVFAEIMTELIKHVHDSYDGIYEMADAFLMGLITAKGFIGLDIDYAKDPLQGDVMIKSYYPMDIMEDPNCKDYDLNKTADFITSRFWWTMQSLELNYPTKFKEHGVDGGFTELDDTSEIKTIETDDYQDAKSSTTDNNQGQVTGGKTTRIRIYDTYWKEYKRQKFIVNLATQEATLIHESRSKVLELLKAKFKEKFSRQFRIIDRVAPTLHRTTHTKTMVLEDKVRPFGDLTIFPIMRFCPYWLHGDPYGMVDDLKDPNREVNKRMSQALHLLNQSAGVGLIGPKGWEVETPEEIEEKIAKSGFSIHYNPDKGKPEFTKPPQLSEGHVTLASIAAESIKVISNVNTGMLAQTTKLSGIALEISRQQGIMGSEVMFDNFDRTQKIYGDTIREVIQRTNLISDQEIMSIIEDGKIKDAAELKDFRSIRKGRFGIKISQSENTPTRRIANYELLKSAVKEGMPISPVFLFEASDLPNKDDIVADLKKKEQAAQAQAQEQATLAKAQIELEQAKLKADVEKARALAVKAQAEAVKAQAETARLLKEGAPKPQ